MTVPDKIYLNRRHPEPYWFNVKQLDSDVEYIRKDALIKWFNDNIKSLNVLFGEIFVARVKDKLNSM